MASQVVARRERGARAQALVSNCVFFFFLFSFPHNSVNCLPPPLLLVECRLFPPPLERVAELGSQGGLERRDPKENDVPRPKMIT